MNKQAIQECKFSDRAQGTNTRNCAASAVALGCAKVTRIVDRVKTTYGLTADESGRNRGGRTASGNGASAGSNLLVSFNFADLMDSSQIEAAH